MGRNLVFRESYLTCCLQFSGYGECAEKLLILLTLLIIESHIDWKDSESGVLLVVGIWCFFFSWFIYKRYQTKCAFGEVVETTDNSTWKQLSCIKKEVTSVCGTVLHGRKIFNGKSSDATAGILKVFFKAISN